MALDIEIRTGRRWADLSTEERARLIAWWQWDQKRGVRL